jgi:hypothetical protein
MSKPGAQRKSPAKGAIHRGAARSCTGRAINAPSPKQIPQPRCSVARPTVAFANRHADWPAFICGTFTCVAKPVRRDVPTVRPAIGAGSPERSRAPHRKHWRYPIVVIHLRSDPRSDGTENRTEAGRGNRVILIWKRCGSTSPLLAISQSDPKFVRNRCFIYLVDRAKTRCEAR